MGESDKTSWEKHLHTTAETVELIEQVNKRIDDSHTALSKTISNFAGETMELRNEWRELKNKAFYVLIVAVTVSVGYGVWVGTIQTSVNNQKEAIEKNTILISSIDDQNNSAAVALGKIETRLTNIENSLAEMKKLLK